MLLVSLISRSFQWTEQSYTNVKYIIYNYEINFSFYKCHKLFWSYEFILIIVIHLSRLLLYVIYFTQVILVLKKWRNDRIGIFHNYPLGFISHDTHSSLRITISILLHPYDNCNHYIVFWAYSPILSSFLKIVVLCLHRQCL